MDWCSLFGTMWWKRRISFLSVIRMMLSDYSPYGKGVIGSSVNVCNSESVPFLEVGTCGQNGRNVWNDGSDSRLMPTDSKMFQLPRSLIFYSEIIDWDYQRINIDDYDMISLIEFYWNMSTLRYVSYNYHMSGCTPLLHTIQFILFSPFRALINVHTLSPRRAIYGSLSGMLFIFYPTISHTVLFITLFLKRIYFQLPHRDATRNSPVCLSNSRDLVLLNWCNWIPLLHRTSSSSISTGQWT